MAKKKDTGNSVSKTLKINANRPLEEPCLQVEQVPLLMHIYEDRERNANTVHAYIITD